MLQILQNTAFLQWASSHPLRLDQKCLSQGHTKGEATWLYVAARNGHALAVGKLLDLGASVFPKLHMGSTCLHGAAFHNRKQSVLSIKENSSSESWDALLSVTNAHGLKAEQEAKSDIKALLVPK